ncbi:MAG: hypothetical protein ACREDH_14770 [Methylocella sp.]
MIWLRRAIAAAFAMAVAIGAELVFLPAAALAGEGAGSRSGGGVRIRDEDKAAAANRECELREFDCRQCASHARCLWGLCQATREAQQERCSRCRSWSGNETMRVNSLRRHLAEFGIAAPFARSRN